MYIEKYHYNLEFDPVNYFSQFKPGIDYQQNWPIINVSTTRLSSDALIGFWTNFLAGKKRTKPSTILNCGAESVHTAINKALGMKGMTFSLLSACTSGAYALYQASALSAMCGTPVIVAAADNIVGSPAEIHYFNSLGALSFDTGIPFDQNSTGFRPGLGQSFFVISAKPIAPLAKIKTMRFFTQSNEKTSVGSLEEIKANLFAGVDLTDVSWWNAHAPGTPVGDDAEYRLFNDLCNASVPISSIKGVTGHLLASSYLVELAIALDCVAQGYAKGNAGIKEPINNDPRIIRKNTPIKTKTFLKFNMGFSGKNVLSIVERF